MLGCVVQITRIIGVIMSLKKFPEEIKKYLGCYVYRLVDPTNSQTFYVGKGKGDRVFSHGNAEARKKSDDVNDIVKRIRKIRKADFEVEHIIHRHGLDENTALEVEAALIDEYPGALNQQKGHHSNKRGCMNVKQVIEQYVEELAKKSGKLPIYKTPEIIESAKERLLFIVESEKVADAAMMTKNAKGKSPLFTTWMGGTGQKNLLEQHNWEILKDRKVYLIADADQAGRDIMQKLERYLVDVIGVAQCKMVLPEGETGYDLADCLLENRNNYEHDFEAVWNYIMSHGKPLEIKQAETEETQKPWHFIENNDYYKLLGHDGEDRAVFRNKKTNALRILSARDLGQQLILQSLAPPDFWQSFQSKPSTSIHKDDLMEIQAYIMQLAHTKGIYDPGDILGRGATNTSRGVLVFNAGNKLYQQSQPHSEMLDEVIDISDSIDNFESGEQIKIAEDISQGENYCRALCSALMRYRWEEPNDGVVFCGWIVTALIGGALEQRPAIWISASAGRAKHIYLQNLAPY